MTKLRQTFLPLALAALAAGCGAPVKSAAEVAGLFDDAGTSLQQKASDLCNTLAARSEIPNTKGMKIDLGDCSDAGKSALEYKNITGFYFAGLDDKVPSKDDTQLIHKTARGQVWLNRSLLGLAASVSSLMQKKAGGDNTGLINLPDSGNGGIGGLVKPKIEVLEEPTLDTEKLEFAMKIHLQLTGAVNADHTIQIQGGLVGNAIGVTVKTLEDRTFEQSILKNFQVVILIIPHAGDLYMDMFVDLNIYNIGLETLFKDQINTFLSTGLKSVIDSTMQL